MNKQTNKQRNKETTNHSNKHHLVPPPIFYNTKTAHNNFWNAGEWLHFGSPKESQLTTRIYENILCLRACLLLCNKNKLREKLPWVSFHFRVFFKKKQQPKNTFWVTSHWKKHVFSHIPKRVSPCRPLPFAFFEEHPSLEPKIFTAAVWGVKNDRKISSGIFATCLNQFPSGKRRFCCCLEPPSPSSTCCLEVLGWFSHTHLLVFMKTLPWHPKDKNYCLFSRLEPCLKK